MAGVDCNLKQAESGMAWHYKKYQDEQELEDRSTYAHAEYQFRREKVLHKASLFNVAWPTDVTEQLCENSSSNGRPTMHTLLKVTSLLLSLLATSTAFAGPFIDLGSLGGQSEAWGINELGQVVGHSNFVRDDHGNFVPVIWSNGSINILEMNGASTGIARQINESGQIVGNLGSTGALWNNPSASPTTLNGLSAHGSSALAINDSGVIVGVSGIPGHATVWNNTTTPTDIDSQNPLRSGAYAVNNNGIVVGIQDVHASGYHATVWDSNSITVLENLDDGSSFATDINDHGQIVGYSDITGNTIHYNPVTWVNGSITNLGSFVEWGMAFAEAINNSGQIVGHGDAPGNYGGFTSHALLWDDGQVYDLNSFLDSSTREAGWELITARDINDAGWVVGRAHNHFTKEAHAYMLSLAGGPVPIPEPETYSMLLLGLAFLAAKGKRKKAIYSY